MNTRLIGFFIFLAVLVAMVVAANGAALPGTIVAAEIVPGGDDANTFSIGNTTWMKGTMKQVPDIATRDLITADRRSEGMFCYVTGETNLYALVGGTNNANWTLWASPTNSGATIVQVQNFVETNVFQTIHVLTNFFDTVYVTNKLELLFLTPNTAVIADANDNLASVANAFGVYTNNGTGGIGWNDSVQLVEADTGTLVVTNPPFLNLLNSTNLSGTNVDIVAGSGVTLTTNNHRVTVTATGSGGTVTSVGLQTTGTGLGVSGTPVTTSGTLSLDSPSAVLTNFESAVTVFSNHVKINVTHALFPSNATPSSVAWIGADNSLTNVGTGQIPIADLASSSVTFSGTSTHITGGGTVALGGSATPFDVGSSVPLLDANNVWASTSSNFVNNAVVTWATNANNTTPDFAVPTSLLSTNANFTWLAPTHIGGTKAELWMKTSVTNSSGSLITMTAPANVHVCGAGAMNVTNWTEILWQYFPPSGPTNMFPIPAY